MSAEEIIEAWKHNEDHVEKPPKREQSSTAEKSPEGKVPSNPAGQQELRDEDLEAVEGGGTVHGNFFTIPSSCFHYSC